MAAPALDGLPADVRRKVAKLSSEVQTKVAALHGVYHFDDASLECFTINHGSLTRENLPAFEESLKEEMAENERKALAMSKREPAAKRARPARNTLQLDDLVTTPNPKRRVDAEPESGSVVPGLQGEGGKAARGTPDPLPKPPKVNITLKSSMNEKLAKPEASAKNVRVELIEGSMAEARQVYAFMDEPAEERAAAHDATLMAMEGPLAEVMCKRHSEGEEAATLGVVGQPTQAEVVLCGRIVCESLEGKLNERSIMLEGSKATSNCAKVQLNISSCPQVAAFPGQIAAVVGRIGSSGTIFHARDFLSGIPCTVGATVGDAVVGLAETSLHMMMAAGPFCLRDGLDYSPLARLFEHAAETKPLALVLCGPFLDTANLKVTSGETVLPDSDEILSFEEVYRHAVLPVLIHGVQTLRRLSPQTEVILVPALEEALSFHPLPQPPLEVLLGLEPGIFEPLQKLGVKLLPNPVHLRINGLRVSVSATDALSPVLRDLVLRPAGRRIEEALRLLLLQQTLFPVLPRDPPQVSDSRAAALRFPEGKPPHICIFPSLAGGASSTLVDDCVFVNPGPLCKANLGTFAELWMVPSGPTGAPSAPLRERVRVDIQRLSA